MQEIICSPLQFSQRTDALASLLGCYLKDLPAKIGISERALFGYRTGRYPVTAKALRKLQAAEDAAGIRGEVPEMPAAMLREESPEYRVRQPEEPTMVERLEILQRGYEEARAELAETNRKLDALIDLFTKMPKP